MEKKRNERGARPNRVAVMITVAAVALTVATACTNHQTSEPSEQSGQTTGEVSLNLTAELRTPNCDKTSGFYAEGLKVTLSTDTTGGHIYYTTDGSTPTADSTEYLLPIEITDRSAEANCLSVIPDTSPNGDFTPADAVKKGTVIKAVTIAPDGTVSDVLTRSFFVGFAYEGLPVVSLSTDQLNFFDDATGIYRLGDSYQAWMENDPTAAEAEVWEVQGNYSQKGREWERPVSFELIEPDGKAFTQNLGIRIMGTATRTYFQKSFRLYARTDYGEKRVNYALIPGVSDANGEALEKYKTFLLRNGGNDADYAKLRDPLIQELFADCAVSTQGNRPAVVFLNGEFWGIYTLTEDYSDNWIAYHYNVPKEDVVLIKCGELEAGMESDTALFDDFVTEATTKDMTDPAAYQAVCEKMEMQSFIDYYCIQLLIGSGDGPTENNNWRIWRSRGVTNDAYHDGKWRWMLYGTEFSLGLYEAGRNANENCVKKALEVTEGTPALLLQNLMRNETFRKQFSDTYLALVENVFTPEKANPIIDRLEALYAPVMPQQYNRFGPDWVLRQSSLDACYAEQVNQVRTFIQKRHEVLPTHLTKALESFLAAK